MDKEECLDWLCRLRSEIYVYMPKEWIIPMNNALDMAIEALEQTELKPSYYRDKTELDAISRQAVIDAMAKWDWQEVYLPIHFKELLDELPSVSTKKVGHWRYVDYRNARCSNCNYIQTTKGLDKTMHCNIHKAIYKYCPNCGCKMEVEE